MTIKPEHTRALIHAAVLAPSADNYHHAQFEATPQGLRIWADTAHQHGTERHRHILTEISFGMILESIEIKASSLGYRSNWLLNPAPEIVAELTLHQCDASATDLASYLEARHTNRRFYSRRAARQEALEQIQRDAQPHAELMWLEGPCRAAALHLIRLAETERFRRRYLHAELFSGVRFDVGWRATCDEGLAPGSLEVEPGMRSAFKLLGSWSFMSALTKVGAHHMLGLRAGLMPCKLSPHLALICTAGSPETTALQAGRAFQRVWLRATALGLALQPLAASVILPFQNERVDGASSETKAALGKGWANIVGSGRCPLMLFRLGYASPPSQVSGRLPVERYLKRPK